MSNNNNYNNDNGRVLRRRTPVVQTARALPQQQQPQTNQKTASAETIPDSFTRSDIVGDGNCLFRAVSLHLYGHQNNHEKLREAALRYLQQNWSELHTFSLIEDDDMKDFNNYYNYMRKNGTYGTSLEILALSEIQNSNFHIFSKQRRTRDTKITFRDRPTIISTGEHTETIYLLLTGNPMSGHFELLTPQNTQNIPNNSRLIKEASGERRNGRGRRGKWQLDQNDEDRATENGPAKSVVPASKPVPTKAGKSKQRMHCTTGINENVMRCYNETTRDSLGNAGNIAESPPQKPLAPYQPAVRQRGKVEPHNPNSMMVSQTKQRPLFSVGPTGPERGSSRDTSTRAGGAKNQRRQNTISLPIEHNKNGFTKRHKPKHIEIQLATYNCRTLSDQTKILELEIAASNIKWDVIGLSETRRREEELIELQSGHLLYHKGTPNGRTSGVGFLINKVWKNKIVSVSGISDRVASLTLRLSKRYTLQIIQVYAPTSSHDDEEIEEFYNDVNQALDKNNSHFRYIIGDFNAKVGKKMNNETEMGEFGFGERNERGERLIQYAHHRNLYIMNSFFKKGPNRKWTWEAPNATARNEIDFIMTNKMSTVKNVEVLNRFRTGSDHRLVRAKITIDKELERLKLVRKPTSSRIDTNRLQENSTQYQALLEERLQGPKDSIQLIETVLNCAKLIGGTQQRQQHNKLSAETKELIRQRGRAKRVTWRNRVEYTEMCKTIRKKMMDDIRKYNERIVETAIANRKSYKGATRALTIGRRQVIALINGNDRITDRQEIIKLVTEFYSNLYQNPVVLEEDVSTPSNEHIPEVLVGEVENAIKGMKNGKAAGNDGVTIELLKYAGRIVWKILAKIYTDCLKAKRIPEHWNSANIILIHKKGSKEDLRNYRPISLLPTIYKVFTKIICNRIQATLDAAQPREQAGFRSGFSTIDHIHTLREIISRTREYQLPLAIAFVDFEKAFDSIYPRAIIEALTEQGVDKPYVEILANIYKEAKARVDIYEGTPEFPTNKGVRQGDAISPKLFTATLETALSKIDWNNKGLQIDGEWLNHLRFADDIVLIAKSPEELQQQINDLNTAINEVGLKMNYSKTKIMYNQMIDSMDITINDTTLEIVEEYVYLGQLIHISSSLLPEINRRIKLGWRTFGRNSVIFKSKMPIHLKSRTFDQCILPVLTYGCETWTLKADITRKLQVAQRAMERCMLGLTKEDRKRNEWIRERTRVTDVIQRVKSLKWQWAGHLARRTDNRWSSIITHWYPRGSKRPKKRPNMRWDYDIRKLAGITWPHTAQDRVRWREIGNAIR